MFVTLLRLGNPWTAGVVAVCGLLFALAPSAFADGTLMTTANSTQYNPCNGDYLRGTIENLIVVQTNQTAEGTHVIVQRTFHGTLKDSAGNVYEINSAAQTEFDAVTTTGYYSLPFNNNVVAPGAPSLNFTTTGMAKLYVDANQNPTGYGAVVTGEACKGDGN